VPIETPAGGAVGYFSFGEPHDKRAPTLETVQTIEIFVNQVAIALETARLFAALEERLNQARRVNELAALNRLSAAVASSLEMSYILEAAIQEVAHTLHPDFSAIWLLHDEQGILETAVTHHNNQAPGTEAVYLASQRLLREVIQDGHSRLYDRPGMETLAVSPLAHGAGPVDSLPDLAEELSSAMLAPMIVRENRIGIIGVFAEQQGVFDAQALTLLNSMAATVAMAIENARLYAESKAFATELAASQAQLIQSAKLAATGQLAASIAHEINNPLQAVQSCIYLIADSAQAADANTQYLDIARDELERIARIVGRMLSFHQPTTDAQEPTDINALIETILALAHKRLQHSDISIQTNLATDLWPVYAVRDHIKQVLLNLFLNALEAMPEGGTLQVQTANAEDEWVTVAIQDNGLGINPGDLPHLFDPFFTTKPKGTGLGLSISYDIIAQHGGKILVDSEPGIGTTFTIRLPTHQGASKWQTS
jgi:two-component system NtrC family sensor kinase